MHVLLLRHGQTDENAKGILQGQSQTELNDLGREQAKLLAGRLRAYVPRAEVLITSDLARARQTADALASALRLDYEMREAWRERGFGPFEGRTIGDADIWRAANGHWDLPGAEPTSAFQLRVRAALEDLARDFAMAGCVAVVTHGAVLRNILNLLRDGRLPLVEGEPRPESVPIANCAIMHLEARWGDESVPAWRIHGVNVVDHLTSSLLAPLRVEE
ncbi:MAG: histidine phosphatase family protein [Acidobacteria bacterium]|nr:histidine phosphatase family protein [Acidobacteriota bacterium]